LQGDFDVRVNLQISDLQSANNTRVGMRIRQASDNACMVEGWRNTTSGTDNWQAYDRCSSPTQVHNPRVNSISEGNLRFTRVGEEFSFYVQDDAQGDYPNDPWILIGRDSNFGALIDEEGDVKIELFAWSFNDDPTQTNRMDNFEVFSVDGVVCADSSSSSSSSTSSSSSSSSKSSSSSTDATSEIVFFFDSRGAAIWTNPDNMIDGLLGTVGVANSANLTQLLNGNDSTDAGGTISSVELRAYARRAGTPTAFDLRPVFPGGDGDNHDMIPSTSGSLGWTSYFDITTDTNAPGSWTWADVASLDCDVAFLRNAGDGPSDFVNCSKVEIRVTYQN